MRTKYKDETNKYILISTSLITIISLFGCGNGNLKSNISTEQFLKFKLGDNLTFTLEQDSKQDETKNTITGKLLKISPQSSHAYFDNLQKIDVSNIGSINKISDGDYLTKIIENISMELHGKKILTLTKNFDDIIENISSIEINNAFECETELDFEYTPLELAITKSVKYPISNSLIEKLIKTEKIDLNTVSNSDQEDTPLIHAINVGAPLSILNLLIESGSNINEVHQFRNSLINAITSNNEVACQFLLSKNDIEIDYSNINKEKNHLLLAISNNNINIARLIINHVKEKFIDQNLDNHIVEESIDLAFLLAKKNNQKIIMDYIKFHVWQINEEILPDIDEKDNEANSKTENEIIEWIKSNKIKKTDKIPSCSLDKILETNFIDDTLKSLIKPPYQNIINNDKALLSGWQLIAKSARTSVMKNDACKADIFKFCLAAPGRGYLPSHFLRVIKGNEMRNIIKNKEYNNIIIPKEEFILMSNKNFTVEENISELKNDLCLYFVVKSQQLNLCSPCQTQEIFKNKKISVQREISSQLCKLLLESPLIDIQFDNLRFTKNGKLAIIDTEPLYKSMLLHCESKYKSSEIKRIRKQHPNNTPLEEKRIQCFQNLIDAAKKGGIEILEKTAFSYLNAYKKSKF